MNINKAKSDQSFRIDDLLNGKINRNDFQIDYLPMLKMLDETDRRLAAQGGLASLKTEDIWKRIYDYGVITVSLDKADMQTRIDELNAQNLKWYTRADQLELELNILKEKYAKVCAQGISVSEETNQETEGDPQ